MKKITSLFLMSFVGMIGTYGLAGSTREETVTRLQNSVDVLHAIISTPDKRYPGRSVEQREVLSRGAGPNQGWIHFWWQRFDPRDLRQGRGIRRHPCG